MLFAASTVPIVEVLAAVPGALASVLGDVVSARVAHRGSGIYRAVVPVLRPKSALARALGVSRQLRVPGLASPVERRIALQLRTSVWGTPGEPVPPCAPPVLDSVSQDMVRQRLFEISFEGALMGPPCGALQTVDDGREGIMGGCRGEAAAAHQGREAT